MMRGLVFLVATVVFSGAAFADPLPSWNTGPTKAAIVDFVERVTDPAGPDYVTPAERIAVFDNDGNLWAEKPFYFQLLFAMDYLAERAEADPSLLSSDVLKAAGAGDLKTALAGGEEALLEIVAASHSGMTVEAFIVAARKWMQTATHPKAGRPYGEHVYQPMLELLAYLRDEGFSTFIVSGGGIHMIHAFAEEVYGIPPQNVIGSVGESSYEIVDGQAVIMKQPGIAFIDDKGGKPIGIDRSIGRRPIFASGNSDGDFQMLEWTTGGPGPRFGLIVHHTDETREWAYDRDSHVGRLDKALDAAAGNGWTVIDMKADWRVIYPFELE
jgi:phosphoserine phosphatase